MANFSNAWLLWFTVIITFVILVLLWKRSRFRKLIDQLPGPPEFLFLGNITSYKWDHSEIFNMYVGWFKEYGKHKIYKFSTVVGVYAVLSSASAVEPILNSSCHIEKSSDYSWLEPWLGNGLLVSNGEKWKKRRKMLTPAFHFKILEDFSVVFNEHSKALVKQLSKKVGLEVFDIFPYITLCTLDIICETAMGRHLNAQTDKDSEYVKALYKISEIIFSRIYTPWLHVDWIFRLLPASREQDRCLKILHGFTRKVIEERKQEMKQFKTKHVESQEDALLGKRKRLAFLDLLLETSKDGKILSDEDIREEVDTFMFEGHDTTAAAISFTLYLLGHNLDHQSKVQKELEDVLGCSKNIDHLITLEDLTKMKYLECVIKESLRLFPSVPFIARKLTKDVCIENKIIPKGAVIQITPYIIHRDPEVYPDPEKFDPERFTIDKIVNRNPYSYIPFSAGPRNCIGQKFAMMEAKIVVAHILGKYMVKSAQSTEELKLVPDLILRPLNGFRVTLTARK